MPLIYVFYILLVVNTCFISIISEFPIFQNKCRALVYFERYIKIIGLCFYFYFFIISFFSGETNFLWCAGNRWSPEFRGHGVPTHPCTQCNTQVTEKYGKMSKMCPFFFLCYKQNLAFLKL